MCTEQEYACKVLVPCFMSWNKRYQKCSIRTESLFLSNFGCKCVYIPVSEHFSFAKITQHDHYTGAPCAGRTKKTLKVCHRCLKLREHSIGMLTAGMSTRAVARELNVNFSTSVVLENLEVRPTADHASDNVVNRVPHGSGEVMVWAAGISYEHNCNVNTQRWCEKSPLLCHSSAPITSC